MEWFFLAWEIFIVTVLWYLVENESILVVWLYHTDPDAECEMREYEILM